MMKCVNVIAVTLLLVGCAAGIPRHQRPASAVKIHQPVPTRPTDQISMSPTSVANAMECEVLFAIARDALKWGQPDTPQDRLNDSQGYWSSCNWKTAGFREPPQLGGRLVTFSPPVFYPTPEQASITATVYSGGLHGIILNAVCYAKRTSEGWRGIYPCKRFEDAFPPLPPTTKRDKPKPSE